MSFVIKVLADYIWQTGKILYKRYIIPMFIVSLPLFFYNKIISCVGIHIPFKLFQAVHLVTFLIIAIILVIKAGLIRGICLFILHVAGVIFCACVIYASIVVMAMLFALMMGGSWLIEEKFIRLTALTLFTILSICHIGVRNFPLMPLFYAFLILLGVKFRKIGIAFYFSFYFRQIQHIGQGQRLFVQTAATGYIYIFAICKHQCLLQRRNRPATGLVKIFCNGHNNGLAARQRAADFFISPTPHHYGVPHGQFFKPLLFSRDIPGDPSLSSNDPVRRHGCDQCDHPAPPPLNLIIQTHSAGCVWPHFAICHCHMGRVHAVAL